MDTVNTEAGPVLKYGVFNLPNVFTPDQEYTIENFDKGGNDIFRSEDISVVTIEITIFDRAGRKMHDVCRRYKGLERLGRKCNGFKPEGSGRRLFLGGILADLFQEP